MLQQSPDIYLYIRVVISKVIYVFLLSTKQRVKPYVGFFHQIIVCYPYEEC